MKAKKVVTKAAQARALLADNPNLTAKELAGKLEVSINRAYVILSNARKKLKETSKPVAKKRGRPAKNQYEYVNGAQVLKSDDAKALQAEVKKLNEWCLEWRSKYDQLQDDLRLVQAMYAESRAVIRYLESKVK